MQGEYMTISWPEDWFAQFWSAYPRRVAKKDAFRALDRVRKAGEVEFKQLIVAVGNFARSVSGKDRQYIPYPATWINGGRWDDEVEEVLDDYAWREYKRRQIGVSKYQ